VALEADLEFSDVQNMITSDAMSSDGASSAMMDDVDGCKDYFGGTNINIFW
jgi:hypothetical protein